MGGLEFNFYLCNPFQLVVQTLLHHFSDWYVDALFAEFYLGFVYASCPCD